MESKQTHINMEQLSTNPDPLQEREDCRMKKIKELASVNREIKRLQQSAVGICMDLVQYQENPNLNKEMYAIVDNLHGKVLDGEDEIACLNEMAMCSLESKDYDLFNKHKNRNMFSLMTVYEKHEDDAKQKKLVRNGFLRKKVIKKQKTPNNYLNCLVDSKNLYLKDLEFKDMQRRLALVEVKQQKIDEVIGGVKFEVETVKDDVSGVKSEVRTLKEQRNQVIVSMYLSGKKITQKEISQVLGVPFRTVQRVLQKIKAE